jgi:hypothetical protein
MLRDPRIVIVCSSVYGCKGEGRLMIAIEGVDIIVVRIIILYRKPKGSELVIQAYRL